MASREQLDALARARAAGMVRAGDVAHLLARDDLLALDAAWAERGLFLALHAHVEERNAADRTVAWRRWVLTPKGRPRRMPADKAAQWRALDHVPEARAWLVARSERRVALIYRLFERERQAYKAHRFALLEAASPLVGDRWSPVFSIDDGAYRTVGLGKAAYARAEAEMVALDLEAAGISVVVGEASPASKPLPHVGPSCLRTDPTRVYVVNAKCEEIDAEIARYHHAPSTVEWVRRCWARGVNPRVFNPFLPHGFEERHGLDYFGGRKVKELET